MKRQLAHAVIFLLCLAFQIHGQVIHVPADSSSIQSAINGASEGDTVLVEEGTYYENINFRGKAITVASQFLLDGDTSHISKTIINGSQPAHPDTASVVLMISGEDTTSVLSGFTITGGKGSYIMFDGVNTALGGGGVVIFNAGGKIERNIIEGNNFQEPREFVLAYGFGICALVRGNHTVVIRNNIVRDNTYTGFTNGLGPGLCLLGGRILVEGNTISGNSSDSETEAVGGGILHWCTADEGVIPELIIRNNTIHDNEVTADLYQPSGGGIFLRGFNLPWDIRIQNNLIFNNRAHNGRGGGIEIWEAKPVLSNNTLVNNMAEKGKQLGTRLNAGPTLFNNILWSDGDDGISEIHTQSGEGITIRAVYNNVRGGWPGIGNIDGDPLFETGSFALSEISPCIGSGVDSVKILSNWYYALPTDIEGNPRPDPVDAYVDMGAMESGFALPVDLTPPTLITDRETMDPDTGFELEVTSSEDGYIFLVPENTESDLAVIRNSMLQDSVEAVANTGVPVTILAPENRTYWLYAIDASENLSQYCAVEITGVGIEDHAEPFLRIFPNPSTGYIKIFLRRSDLYTVEIISTTGQVLQQEDLAGNTMQIDIRSFREGMYYIRVRSDEAVKTCKIIKW